MDLAPYKIKLSKNKVAGKSFHQYVLTYKTGRESAGQAGYPILSALAGDSDLILELDTELFYGVSQDPDRCAEKLLKDIRSLNLDHSSRLVASRRPVRFFGLSLERKDGKQAHQIAAYVPNRIWKEPFFRDVLPACGARYYITREPMDARTVLDGLFTLSDEQKVAMFRLILFHLAEHRIVGIMSAEDQEVELRSLLGLR